MSAPLRVSAKSFPSDEAREEFEQTVARSFHSPALRLQSADGAVGGKATTLRQPHPTTTRLPDVHQLHGRITARRTSSTRKRGVWRSWCRPCTTKKRAVAWATIVLDDWNLEG